MTVFVHVVSTSHALNRSNSFTLAPAESPNLRESLLQRFDQPEIRILESSLGSALSGCEPEGIPFN